MKVIVENSQQGNQIYTITTKFVFIINIIMLN